MSNFVDVDTEPVVAPIGDRDGGLRLREATAVVVCDETGCTTEIYSCSYTNRHLVVVTQKKKFGTMVCCLVF